MSKQSEASIVLYLSGLSAVEQESHGAESLQSDSAGVDCWALPKMSKMTELFL